MDYYLNDSDILNYMLLYRYIYFKKKEHLLHLLTY